MAAACFKALANVLAADCAPPPFQAVRQQDIGHQGEQLFPSVTMQQLAVRLVMRTSSSACSKPLVPDSKFLCLQDALLGWKSGKVQILVATDVAGRGLHIKDLPYVINYDFPTNLDTYVHRVGRTGRLATDGHAYSFFTRNLAPVAQPLLTLLKVWQPYLCHCS